MPKTLKLALCIAHGALTRTESRGAHFRQDLPLALRPPACIVWGNLAAMRQPNLRRMMAYSSIAHAGCLDRIDELPGLFHRQPFAAIVVGLAMLSLAGIPPLPGFIAKFLIFGEVMASGHTLVAVLGLVGSYLGLYFYLRVIQAMFMGAPAAPGSDQAVATLSARAWAASVLCLLLGLAVALTPGRFLAIL